jgi:hypothetical protein
MERDSATGGVVMRALGDSFDAAGVAGGAHERFLVPIRGDQYERFRRAVFLDAPTSHGCTFPAEPGWQT